MKITKFLSAALFMTLTLGVAPAFGDTMYSYTGNPMVYSATGNANVCAGSPCILTESFTMATPLGNNVPFSYTNISPESFSFTDGIQTLTNTNASIVAFDFGTDSNGNINNWVIEVMANGYNGWIYSESNYTPGGVDESYNGYSIYNVGSSGAWNLETLNPAANGDGEIDPVPTPEPGTWLLLLSGTVGLVFFGRIRRTANA